MRHSDSLYYFEDGYCGGCGLTDRGLPCAAAECFFPTCGDEDYDDGVTFYTYGDDSTLATNYTDGRTVFSGDADDLTLSSQSVMTSRSSRGSARYGRYRRDGVGDRIMKRLQTIDERNKSFDVEPMTTGLSCLSASFAGQDDASTILMTRIAPLPTVEEGSQEGEITAVEPMMRLGEASAASKSGSGTAIPHSNTMFSSRSAKSTKSTKTEKTSSSVKSFPGALIVAKAGTKLRSTKLPEAKLKQRMLALHMATMGMASSRLGSSKQQQRGATGIIGAKGGSVEVIDLDRRDDRADEQDPSTAKVSNLIRGQNDERESVAGLSEDNTNSNNGTMTTVKTAAGAMGSALTILNVKKMKARHDTVKKANAIEADARKYSDLGQWNIAERKYEESLRIKKEVLPEGHDEITKTLDLLAMARIEQSDYAGAIDPVEEALEVRRKAKGRDDLGVVNQLHSLAFLCRISGNTAKLAEVNKEIGKVCKVPAM